MSRFYTVEFENVSVSAEQDLFEIAPADDKPCAIHALYLAQFSDVGDAAEEILRWRIIRGHTTSGSGGTVPTPRPLNPTDTPAGFVAEVNNTTIASVGTPVNLHSDGFNIRVPGQWVWTPDRARPICSQAQGLIVVRLMAAPADAVTMSGVLYLEEMG